MAYPETDLPVKEWAVPKWIADAFPDIEIKLTPYSIPTAWYAHRISVHSYFDGLEATANMSRVLVVDAVDNVNLQEMVIHRINNSILREKEKYGHESKETN